MEDDSAEIEAAMSRLVIGAAGAAEISGAAAGLSCLSFATTLALNVNTLFALANVCGTETDNWKAACAAVMTALDSDPDGIVAMLSSACAVLPALCSVQSRVAFIRLLAEVEDRAVNATSWWGLPDGQVTPTATLFLVNVSEALFDSEAEARWVAASDWMVPTLVACERVTFASESPPCPELGGPVLAGGAPAWAARYALTGTGPVRNPSTVADVDVFLPKGQVSRVLANLFPAGVEVSKSGVLTLACRRADCTVAPLVQLVPSPVGLPGSVLSSFDLSHVQAALKLANLSPEGRATVHLLASASAVVSWLDGTTRPTMGRSWFPSRWLKAGMQLGYKLVKPFPTDTETFLRHVRQLEDPDTVEHIRAAWARKERATLDFVARAFTVATAGTTLTSAMLRDVEAQMHRGIAASCQDDWSSAVPDNDGDAGAGAAGAGAGGAGAATAAADDDYVLADVPWVKCNRAAYNGRVWCDLFGEAYRALSLTAGPVRDRYSYTYEPNRVRRMEKYEMNSLLVGVRLAAPCAFEQRYRLPVIEWRCDTNSFTVRATFKPDGTLLRNSEEGTVAAAFLQTPQPLTFGLPWTRRREDDNSVSVRAVLRFCSELYDQWSKSPAVKEWCETVWRSQICVRFAATITVRGFVLDTFSRTLCPVVVDVADASVLPFAGWKCHSTLRQ
jgi:hypothetical protein